MANKTEGTLGRVYGGAVSLLHYRDGTRVDAGREIAAFIDAHLRQRNGNDQEKQLCPGCFMVAIYNAATHLAVANGQSLSELGRSLGTAFMRLANGDHPPSTEEILILLDPDELEEVPDREIYIAFEAYRYGGM